MKRKILLLTALCTVFFVNAKVYTVDNNTGSSADYGLLQTAIDIASSGDTIYVSGSPNYYDNRTMIRLNKQLTIIGPGYFLGENENTQSSNQTAKIYDMEIGEGANHSLLMGLDFQHSRSSVLFSKDKRDGSVGTSPANNVILKRNIFYSLEINYSSNIVVEQCFFLANLGNITLDKTCSNVLIQNNIIDCGNANYTIRGDYQEELANIVIKNNTMRSGLYRILGVEISNNVFMSGGLNDCDNNTLKNNVFVNAQEIAIPTGSDGNTLIDNIFSVNSAELFNATGQLIDRDFVLKAGSPAEGAGIEGVDAGAYGGINSYKFSGLPPIPSIFELTTNGVGTKEDGLSVTIKARSNN